MPSDAISIMSAPVWKALPSPVWTMTRTAGSTSNSFHASANSSRMALFIALRRSGRLLINQPTGPWRSIFRVSYTVASPSRRFSVSRFRDWSCGRRCGPARLPLLGEGRGPLDLVGMAPQGDQLGGTGLAGVGEPPLEGSPQRPLRGRHGGGRIAGDLLGQRLRLLAQAFWWVDHLTDHAERQRSLGGHALVPSDQGHAQHRFEGHATGQPDQLVGRHLSHRHVGVEKRGVGRRDHDVGVGDPVESPAGADPVDRRDDGLPDAVLPGREVKVERLALLSVPLEPDAVGRDLYHVGAGLEGLALPGMDDDAYRGVYVQLLPCLGELVAHGVVHRIEAFRAIVDQPANRTVALDLQSFIYRCESLSSILGLTLQGWVL